MKNDPLYAQADEEAVVGILLQNVPTPDGLMRDHFQEPACRTVFDAMQELTKQGRPVDHVSVIEFLKSRDSLEQVGGGLYIDRLIEYAPINQHLDYHLERLIFAHRRRLLHHAGLKFQAAASDAGVDSVEDLESRYTGIMSTLGDAGRVEAKLVSMADLVAPDPDADDELLRHRFLCRGGAAIMVAQAGMGKSSLGRQMALGWAAGIPVFGISPTRPLRQLIIQAENDEGDEASFRNGVRSSGMQIDLEDERNVKIVFCQDRAGDKFLAFLDGILRVNPVDLIWIDPLLSFLGADVNSQVDVSLFLRNGLQPILSRYKVGCIIVHHTAKPLRSSEKAVDMGAYVGAGSAELTNYPRAVLTLECTAMAGVFKLRAPKRGGRLHWDEEDGAHADFRLIAHSGNGRIYWREATKEEAALALVSSSPGRKALTSPEDAVKVLECASEGLTYSALWKAIQVRCGCGTRTAKSVVSDARKDGLISVESGIYKKECNKCN